MTAVSTGHALGTLQSLWVADIEATGGLY